MAVPVHLFDLFGDFRMAWPSTALRDHVGEDIAGAANPALWLGALNDGITVTDIRTGATADGVGVEAQLTRRGSCCTRTGGRLTSPRCPTCCSGCWPSTT